MYPREPNSATPNHSSSRTLDKENRLFIVRCGFTERRNAGTWDGQYIPKRAQRAYPNPSSSRALDTEEWNIHKRRERAQMELKEARRL